MQKVKWSQKVHRMLVLWLSQIGSNRKIHHNISVKLSKWDDWLSIFIIILSSLASVTSFINISAFPERTKNAISIAVGIVSLLAGIMTGISNKLKMGENSQKHQSIAGEYSELSNMIQTTVASNNRPEAGDFMRTITDRINLIQRFGPHAVGNHFSIADLPNYALVRNVIKEKKLRPSLGEVINEKDINLYMSDSGTPSCEDEVIELEEIKLNPLQIEK